jgi:uncharacterized protein (DUF362 family)/Pyruvate/2-oxoacid:ferredoxin oxidoreductase delta subunit
MTVAIIRCDTYDLDIVRSAITALLAPLGGIGRFVRPGMRVLLKPNLLSAADLEKAVTTHPAVVQAVAELAQGAGGIALIGDSPGGPVENAAQVWRVSGMADVAAQTGATLVPFSKVAWKRLNGADYLLAHPVFDADLIINLPKLKTHTLALYTGAVKNLFGAIPGSRKRELHLRAPGIQDFSRVLVDVLELVRPGLTILDGVIGQEGDGPGTGGTPRRYGCLAASADPVALDTVITAAMGFRPGEVLHLAEAGGRGLGNAEMGTIQIEGDRQALDFGRVRLPGSHWYFRAPAWVSAPLYRSARLRPQLTPALCASCGRCAEACPREAIVLDGLPRFDLERCVGCLCCAEICPQGAIATHRGLVARLIGAGR